MLDWGQNELEPGHEICMTERVFKTMRQKFGSYYFYGLTAVLALVCVSKLAFPGVALCAMTAVFYRYFELRSFARYPDLITVFDDRIEFRTRDGKSLLALADENWKIVDWDREVVTMCLKFQLKDRFLYLTEEILEGRELLKEMVRIWPDSFEADPFWEPGKKWNKW